VEIIVGLLIGMVVAVAIGTVFLQFLYRFKKLSASITTWLLMIYTIIATLLIFSFVSTTVLFVDILLGGFVLYIVFAMSGYLSNKLYEAKRKKERNY